jgi:hypothetical protein
LRPVETLVFRQLRIQCGDEIGLGENCLVLPYLKRGPDGMGCAAKAKIAFVLIRHSRSDLPGMIRRFHGIQQRPQRPSIADAVVVIGLQMDEIAFLVRLEQPQRRCHRIAGIPERLLLRGGHSAAAQPVIVGFKGSIPGKPLQALESDIHRPSELVIAFPRSSAGCGGRNRGLLRERPPPSVARGGERYLVRIEHLVHQFPHVAAERSFQLGVSADRFRMDLVRRRVHRQIDGLGIFDDAHIGIGPRYPRRELCQGLAGPGDKPGFLGRASCDRARFRSGGRSDFRRMGIGNQFLVFLERNDGAFRHGAVSAIVISGEVWRALRVFHQPQHQLHYRHVVHAVGAAFSNRILDIGHESFSSIVNLREPLKTLIFV